MTSFDSALVFWPYIDRSIGRILAALDDVDASQLNWKPLPTANSLYTIATHVLGNAEVNLLGVLCGQEVKRDREAEFLAAGQSAEPLHTYWRGLHQQIQSGLEQLPDDALARMYRHPTRGEVTGFEILIIVARHAAEHLGEAWLTRDLILAQSPDAGHA